MAGEQLRLEVRQQADRHLLANERVAKFFALALQTCERQRIAVQNLDEVQALRSLLNDGIERQLGGKRPLAQMRRGGRPGGGGRPRA